MKAIVFEDFGGIDQLKLSQIDAPKPAPDEVQIRIFSAGVNPVDWKIRSGLLKNAMPHVFPIIPGWDAAGIISAVGPDVTTFKVNDEVFAYCRTSIIQWGTYAEYTCVPAKNVAFKPRNISFSQAASIPLAGLTAWQSLFNAAHLVKGETVLIHAGAGGVGSLAIQFAKQAGARMIYTTTSIENTEYVEQLGANIAIDYKKDYFVDVIKQHEPHGIDVVFDTMGGQTYKDSFRLLQSGGRMVSILEQPDPQLEKQFNAKAFYVFVSPNGQELQHIADLIEAELVKPIHLEEMPLEKAGEAQEKNQKGHTRGKIILKIE
jgi:NADPH2:quinone reductase